VATNKLLGLKQDWHFRKMQAVSATVMKLPLRTIIACLSIFTLFSTTGEAGPGVF